MKAKKIILPIVIAVIVAIVLAIGGTFAYIWFKTPLFKKSDDIFANQVENAFSLKEIKFSEYSDTLETYKELSEKSVKSKLNVTANLNISELDKDVQKTINNSKLTIESSTDAGNKNMQSKVGLYTNNSEVLTVDMVKNNNKIGIGCKDIYDKYLVVSADDLIDYLKKQGSVSDEDVAVISKALSGESINTYDLLYISKEDLNHFDDTYSVEKILGLISKDCYSKDTKKVSVDVDGDSVKAYGSYLTLTGADAYKFAEDFLNLVKNDSVVTKIITEKANMLLEYSGESKISEKDVSELLNESFDDLLSEMSSLKNETDAAIQIAIYYNNNKPVRIDFNVLENVDDLDDKETIFSIEYANKKDIYTIYNKGNAYATIENNYEKKSKDEYKGTLTAKVSGMSVGTLDYEIVLKDSESKIYLDLNVPLADISGKVDISSKGNIKKEAVEYTGLISFKYKKESGEIKFDGTIECTDVSIPTLNSSNSLEILKLTDAESKAEAEKILKKASEVLPARLKLLGINIDASSIYTPTVTVPETPTIDTTNPDTQTAIDNAQQILNQVDTSKLTPEMKAIYDQNQQILNSLNR